MIARDMGAARIRQPNSLRIPFEHGDQRPLIFVGIGTIKVQLDAVVRGTEPVRILPASFGGELGFLLGSAECRKCPVDVLVKMADYARPAVGPHAAAQTGLGHRCAEHGVIDDERPVTDGRIECDDGDYAGLCVGKNCVEDIVINDRASGEIAAQGGESLALLHERELGIA
jgi:hypothetical protein